ncbi:MAG: beta-galactosidase [Gammaproteobacteria bacterium]
MGIKIDGWGSLWTGCCSSAAAVLLCLTAGQGGAARADTPKLGSGNAAHPPQVQLSDNYFQRNGHRFVVTGVHWVPAKAGVQWPVYWDPKEIELDFAQMEQMGFNTVRFDLLWAWFEPRPGDYNPEAFEQLDYLIALAHRHHLYLHPTLFVGGEVGEAYWDVPWRHGRNPHTDPEMLRLETNHARELGRRYANEAAILAWDLTDEPPFWIAPDTSDAAAVNWTRLIAGGIRKFDALHPIVVGVSTQDMTHGPFRPDTIAGDVDFFSVHPYTIYTPELFPDAMVSERSTYGAAFETSLSQGAGHSVMVQEMGASSAQYSAEKITQFDRVNLYSALAAGANGFLLWCYTDAAPQQYTQVPYLRSPHETQFGLTTWDRKLKPQGSAFVEFARLVSRLDLDGVEPAAADAAIIIPEEWARTRGDFSRFGLTGPNVLPYVSTSEGGVVNGQAVPAFEGNQALMSAVLASYILAHRAGLKPDLPREYGDWQRHPLVLMPAPLTATDPVFVHVHTDFWAKAADYVRGGGVLYASLAASSAIPDMAALFGARMTDSVPVTDVVLKIVKSFGELKEGDSFRFNSPGAAARHWGTGLEVVGGEVIAVDQDGRPALIAHVLGKGKTLLSAYPIESYLGNQTMAFEGGQNADRLYRALKDWSGVRSIVSTDKPAVEASALMGRGRGYVILANHSGEAQHVSISTALATRTLRQVSAEGARELPKAADGRQVDLPAYGGAILEWTFSP